MNSSNPGFVEQSGSGLRHDEQIHVAALVEPGGGSSRTQPGAGDVDRYPEAWRLLHQSLSSSYPEPPAGLQPQPVGAWDPAGVGKGPNSNPRPAAQHDPA